MKKFCLVLIAILFIFQILCAEIVYVDGLYYSLSGTVAQVVKDQTSDKSVYAAYTSVAIPPSVPYNDYVYPVTSIGTSAFEALTNLQSVTLPSTINTINTDAFYGCTKLGSVNLPEGLTTISLRAFSGCNLSSVTIPSTVTSIGNSAFSGNPLTSVAWLPVTCSIGTDSSAPFYSSNSQITSFTLGEKVETVPAYLCYNMSKLVEVVLPPSVKSLGTHAFHGCTSLKTINLPVTQKTLPVSFLEGCTSLESIHLPATLTTISTDAFYGCSSLSDVNLEEGLTTISLRAFSGCKLSSVTIPSTVTSIGNSAFSGNPLTSVTWLPVTCSIGTDSSAPFYSSNSQITSFTFGENVETVPAYLCYNMSKLVEVVLPPSVKSLGTRSFNSCTSLKSIELPQGVTTIPVSIFENCKALESVVIPSSVSSIYEDAFYGCSGLLAIYNYAFTPQTISARVMYNVNKSTCILYVPIDYLDLYQEAAVWRDFLNIVGVATDLQFEEQNVQLTYLKKDETPLFMEVIKLQVPHAPRVEGFHFLKWEVQQGNLEDGIVLQAVYEAIDPTFAPNVYANPANPVQKLIRDGKVYILCDDKTYSVTGARVK